MTDFAIFDDLIAGFKPVGELEALSFGVEPGAARAYAHALTIFLFYGFYRLGAFAGVAPLMTRLCLRVTYICTYSAVWLVTPVLAALTKLADSVRRRRPADCIIGGPPTKLGYFRWNGKDFVRHPDLSISRVRLTGGTSTVDAAGQEVTSSNWDLIEAVAHKDLSPGESALVGLASNARSSSLERGHVLVHDSKLNLFSSAVVINNILVMCRHKTAGMTHIVVKGTNSTSVAGNHSGVRIALARAHYLDSHGAPTWNEQKHTCTFLDILALPLEKDELSMIGVKSLKDKDLTRKYELQRGTITYATDDFGSIVTEEGSIPEANVKVHNLGLALATIVSQPGASSSGVGVVQNGYKFAGLWLGQPAHSLRKHRGQANLFMHADAVIANLTHMGLMKNPLLERIQQWGDSLLSPGESRESKAERVAREWEEYMEFYAEEREEDVAAREMAYEDAEYWNERAYGTNGDYGYNDALDAAEGAGHARQATSQPFVRLPRAIAAPAPPIPPPQSCPGESLAEQALELTRKNTLLDIDRNIKSWKHGILHGEAPRVLREISYYREEATSDVRERLSAALATPSNALLRDYMQKSSPEWSTAEGGEEIPDRNGDPYFRRVGTYGPMHKGKPKAARDGETDLQQKLRSLATGYFNEKRHGCTKGEYKIPVSSKKNIDRSLRAQAQMATASPPNLTRDQLDDFEAAVELVRQKYSAGIGDAPIKSYLEEGELGLLKTFMCYEDKSSGVSARYRNMKKSAWVKAHPEEVVDLALSRLILIAIAGEQLSDLDPIELVKYGCGDVKEIFMKPEGHSPQKTEEGRFRLIWISSLIDLTVQALLHKADNSAHVDAYQAGTLTCAGLGMGHSSEGLKHLVRAFESEGVARVNVSSDASAFDLSIDGMFIHADGHRRAENCSDPDVGRLVERYAHILSSHVLNNQGDVWLCCKYGVTSSGQLSTTTQNTYARSVMAAYGYCLGWTCTGDDLVGDENFDEKRLLDFGVRSRDVERHVGEADFTSHLINTSTSKAVFGNVEKLLWHLYDTCPDVFTNRERFGSTLYILRDTPGVYEDIAALTGEFGINTEGYVTESCLANDLA